MKYESEVIKEIVDSRGHDKSSLHYESECIKSWIEEAKGAYPKLCDYQSEWLEYISILDDTGGGKDPEEPEPEEPPIGQFPYETVTTNHTATVNHVVPLAYKSAILKGQTDENLQSVQMPVLTTTGKNLFNESEKIEGYIATNSTKEELVTNTKNTWTTPWIKAKPNTSYTIQGGNRNKWQMKSHNKVITFIDNKTMTTLTNTKYIRCYYCNETYKASNVQVEESTSTTSYEPYKAIILTVNEEIELRGIGDVKDELDLLTGQLTQRIGEDGEVLSQEVVKTVELKVVNQDGEPLSKFKPIEGTIHVEVSGTPINPTAVLEVPVEAITQNLNSFIEEE